MTMPPRRCFVLWTCTGGAGSRSDAANTTALTVRGATGASMLSGLSGDSAAGLVGRLFHLFHEGEKITAQLSEAIAPLGCVLKVFAEGSVAKAYLL